MVSIAVSELCKTDLVFVQPGAKINSVYYCHRVFEQGLLLDNRHLSNNDTLFQQDKHWYTVIMVFLLALLLVISVLAKRLAGKSVSDMTYIVSSETLNLNSINQSIT